jgi:hypothetical protein
VQCSTEPHHSPYLEYCRRQAHLVLLAGVHLRNLLLYCILRIVELCRCTYTSHQLGFSTSFSLSGEGDFRHYFKMVNQLSKRNRKEIPKGRYDVRYSLDHFCHRQACMLQHNMKTLSRHDKCKKRFLSIDLTREKLAGSTRMTRMIESGL